MRASASFLEFHEVDRGDNSSPDPHGSYRLTTPRPPDVTASRWNSHGSRWGAAHTAGASTAGESELSGAATTHRFGFDLDSPAVRSTASMERKVPSCPQKQGSNQLTKRHTLQPVGLSAPGFDLEGEEIKPRTLDLGDADPVNMLSLSPMNLALASPAAPPSRPASKQSGLRMPLDLRGQDRRGKRMRVGYTDQEFSIFSAANTDSEGAPSLSRENSSSSSENRNPPPLQHHNSMIDTKVLFERNGWLTTTFAYDDGFEWGPRIGSGSFSDVYSVRHKHRPEEMYAIKKSKRKIHSKKERAEFLREVELANNMPSHPNVVEYFRAWQDELIFYVQMELCQEGTLRHLMQREQGAIHLPAYEPRLWEIVLHIARGLAHIHAYDVVHCDIKPDNILVSADGLFKIGDLGHATFIKAWDEQEGDAKYLSRDLLESKPSTKADIFSFGIMIYEIKSGEDLPGKGQQWEYLRNGSVPVPTNCSVLLGGLVQRSMHPQPESRPTAQDIIDACCNVQMQAALAMASQA